MRVRRFDRRGDRGAVLVVVGAFTMVMIVMTAFVVDMGNQRQNRLQLTTATDAAALDVAQEWANASLVPAAAGFSATAEIDKFDCTVVARSVVRANNDGVDVDNVSCIAEHKGDWGVVTVAATEQVRYQFASAMGNESGSTSATTSVKVTGAAQGGLRPFAVCANLPAIQDFMNGVGGDDVRIDAVKFLTPECGSASGNWGLLDLAGNGATAVARMFAEGYANPVKVSSAPNVCADTTPESCFTASPGAKWNSGPVRSALQYLEGPPGCDAGGPEFSVPMYEQVLDPNGKNAKFPITGFLRVQLMCFSTGGAHLNSLTLKLISFDHDECCSGVSAKNRVLEICDVGTIGGALGSDFESSCGTKAEPPVVGDDCGVHPLLDEEVLVDDAGSSVWPLQVDVMVVDGPKCGDLRLRADAHGIAHTEPAPNPVKSGNRYRFTFPAGTDFGPGGTNLTLVVFEDDFVWDQSATLRTILDPGTEDPDETCEVIKAVTASRTTVSLANNRGTKETTDEVVWTVEFALPSDCGEVTATLHTSPTGPGGEVVVVGASPVSSPMKFTLDAGTAIPNSLQNSTLYLRLAAGVTPIDLPTGSLVALQVK